MSALAIRVSNVYDELIMTPTLVRVLNKQTGSIHIGRLPTGIGMVTELQPGISQVTISPLSFVETSSFVVLPVDQQADMHVVCALQSDKVARMTRPAFDDLDAGLQRVLNSSKLLGFENFQGLELNTGRGLYSALDDLRAAALLNLEAKARATTFVSGLSVWSYVVALRELRQDRCFAIVPQALREEVKNSIGFGLFREVSGALHHPPEGFSGAGSFKTTDRYGNLQLTFFACDDGWVADIDIDESAGFEHVFDVVEHKVGQRHTHPYDVHQLLLQYQGMDSGIRLEAA